MDQCAAERELLLHAARQLPSGAIRKRLESRGAQQLVDTPAPLLLRLPVEPPEEIDVLVDRQSWVEIAAETLWHVGDAGADVAAVPGTSHVAAEYHHPTGLNLAYARDQSLHGGFADTIRTDD